MKHDVTHDAARTHLDDFVDGELERGLHAAVERHVQACAQCGAEVAAIRGLVQRARGLPERIEPRRNLWRDIESGIRGTAEVGTRPRPRAAAGRGWFGWLQPPAWRWAYALGAAAVVVGMTMAVWQMWRSGGVVTQEPGIASDARDSTPAAGVEYISALELECMGAGKSLLASMDGWSGDANAELTASIAAGLDAVNLAIAETRAALGADPQDTELLRLLTARYEQKLALLHGAMRLIEEA